MGHHLAAGDKPLDILRWACEWVDRCDPPHDHDDVGRVVNDICGRHIQQANRRPAAEPAELVVRCLADVQAKTIDWLWPDRIAIGKVSTLAGDPGLGKSFLALDCSARVSRGGKWPDQTECPQGRVIVLSAEYDTDDTIKPRLAAVGADFDQISVIEAVRSSDRERPVSLEQDIESIKDAIERTENVKLVVIDPITTYLHNVDGHSTVDVRMALAPLVRLAQTHRFAVLMVTHLNKGDGQKAIYRVTGSLAFVAASRAAYIVTRDPNDPTREVRLLIPIKNNLGNDRTGLAFVLRDVPFRAQPAVSWLERTVDVDADAALGSGRKTNDQRPREEAKQWLIGQLASAPEFRLPSEELKKRAGKNGLSW